MPTQLRHNEVTSGKSGFYALATCKPINGDLSSIFSFTYIFLFCLFCFVLFCSVCLLCLFWFVLFTSVFSICLYFLFVCSFDLLCLFWFVLFCLHQVNLFFLEICALATCKPQNGDLSSINTEECKGWRTFQPRSFQPRIFNPRFLNPKLQPRTFKPQAFNHELFNP